MNFSTWITNQLEILFDGEEGKITKGAKMFGVSRQTLHNWINGSSFPSMARIPILADIISTETNQKYEEIEIQIVLSIIKKTPA